MNYPTNFFEVLKAKEYCKVVLIRENLRLNPFDKCFAFLDVWKGQKQSLPNFFFSKWRKAKQSSQVRNVYFSGVHSFCPLLTAMHCPLTFRPPTAKPSRVWLERMTFTLIRGNAETIESQVGKSPKGCEGLASTPGSALCKARGAVESSSLDLGWKSCVSMIPRIVRNINTAIKKLMWKHLNTEKNKKNIEYHEKVFMHLLTADVIYGEVRTSSLAVIMAHYVWRRLFFPGDQRE